MAVSLTFDAPVDCPVEAEFTAKLTARSANVAITSATARVPRLVVHVTRKPPRVHGELVVEYADGSIARRSVDGDACGTVIDALALMSAMTLDPNAGATPEESFAPEATAVPKAEALTPRPDVAEEGSSPRDRYPGMHLAVGVGGGAVFGFAPVAAPDASAFVELAWRATAVSPVVRIGFDYASTATAGIESVSGAGIQISRTELAVDGCPHRWAAGVFRVAPCVHVEGGALAAAGTGVTTDRSALRPWVAAGILANVQAHLGSRFFAELSGGARAPLVRDHFYFEPNTSVTIFQAPIVSGFALAGVGLTIL